MKKFYSLFLIMVFTISVNSLSAQVGISTPTPNGALDITSANDGLLIPRIGLTNTTTATVITPTISELVYNTVTINDVKAGFYYWDGTKWIPLQAGSKTGWDLNGNAGTTTANYAGTSDAVDFKLATSGTEKMRVLANGQIVVNNTAVPAAGDRFSVYNTTASDFAICGYSTLTGTGVFGQNTGTGAGVYGFNNNAGGIAVAGIGAGAGVYGQTSGATSAGVFGRADVAAGAAVYGTSNGAAATGVFGTTSGNLGVGAYAQATGTNGTGVYGFANGAGGDGVWGGAMAAGRSGIYGYNNNATGIGILGSSTGNTGTAVFGNVTKSGAVAVYGANTNATGTGIVGAGNGLGGSTITGGSGAAFRGTNYGTVSLGNAAAGGIGITGVGNGITTASYLAGGGGGAFTGLQWGVTGFATTAVDATDRAVLAGTYNSVGATLQNVYVGARIGGVVYKILGPGAASVSTTMKTTQGERVLFAPEAPENWFFDIGEVQLVNGHAKVYLDPIFVDCISDSKPFKVFIQGGEDTMGAIRITRNQNEKSFEVEDLGGQSNGTVQYNIYAIWKTKENLRFPQYNPQDLKPGKSEIILRESTPTTDNSFKENQKRTLPATVEVAQKRN